MNVRKTAVELLDRYELDGAYINLLLSSAAVRAAEVGERAFLTALLYGTVERKLTYDYYICALSSRSTDMLDIHTLNILRIGAHQLLGLDSIPDHAAVNETVALGRSRGERSFINGVLRALIRARDGECLPMPKREKPARFLSVKYSFPVEICKHFIATYGEDGAEQLLRAYGEHGYTDLTVNTLRTTRASLAERICALGKNVHISENTSHGIRIDGSVDPTSLPGFANGEFIVQDEACLAAVEQLEIADGQSIVDVCACPGGKSFAAAILSGDSAEVLSLDIHESKLPLISSGAERLGLTSVNAQMCDAEHPRVELFGLIDCVICDVPCSGLGVLGKKADLRYKDNGAMRLLPPLQYSILCASSKYLRRGGILLYSTCTLNPEENERIVERFLAEHGGEFAAVDFTVCGERSHGGMLTLLPHVHHTDGFFIAKLRRN